MSDQQTSKPVSTRIGQTGYPLVSVIIPAYNRANYIEEAIDSVLSQSYQHFEVLVIDDGSTDNTKEKLFKYKDTVTYVYQQNQGVSAARNNALSIANGSLIAFLDADDRFLPGKLESQAVLLMEYPDVDIVNSGYIIIDEKGEFINDMPQWKYFPVLDTQCIVVNKPIVPGALMVRKAPILKAGGFDTRLHVSEDVDLILRLVLQGSKAIWFPDFTLEYRHHQNSLTNADLSQFTALAYKAVTDFFKRDDLPGHIKCLEKKSIFISLVWLAWKLYMVDDKKLMFYYLEEAARFSPIPVSELEKDLLYRFRDLSWGLAQITDFEKIQNDPEWRQFMDRLTRQ